MTWNELDCNSQPDAQQHLPAVNTHFINTKSQWSPCQGQHKADENWCDAAAASEMESGHPGVVCLRKPGLLYTLEAVWNRLT